MNPVLIKYTFTLGIGVATLAFALYKFLRSPPTPEIIHQPPPPPPHRPRSKRPMCNSCLSCPSDQQHITYPCGHVFCVPCAITLIINEFQETCSTCRAPLDQAFIEAFKNGI